MATVDIILDTRYKRKDNLFPVCYRVTAKNFSVILKSGYRVAAKDWDVKHRKIRNSSQYDNVAQANYTLIKHFGDLQQQVHRADMNGDFNFITSCKDIRQVIDGMGAVENKMTFGHFSMSLARKLDNAGRYGNAEVYRQAANFIKKHNYGLDLPFEKLNYQFLKRAEDRFFAKGGKSTSINLYLRTVRAIFNEAIRSGVVQQKYYPFDKYKSPSPTPVKKSPLIATEVRRILNLDLTGPYEFARDCFMLLFYFRGMDFADLCFLRPENIENNRLVYRRKKISIRNPGKTESISISISHKARSLLHKYENHNDSPFLIPILDSDDPAKQHKQMVYRRKTLNKYLRRIARLADINKPITTKVARYTYSNILKNKGISIDHIKELLGHTTTRTTEIYLHGFSDKELDTIDVLAFTEY